MTLAAPEVQTTDPLARFDAHPRASVVIAAFGFAFTAILFALSETSPTTATLFRAIYAVPFLWLIARRERVALVIGGETLGAQPGREGHHRAPAAADWASAGP